jgi:hypothetical protein
MQTRSQSRMLAQTYTATPKKTTRCSSSSNSSNSSNSNNKTNNVSMDTPTAPVKHCYRTRSTISNQSLNNVKKNLNQEFDAIFFDECSTAWNQNKIKLGNGMYAYRTRSTSKK